MAKTLDSGAEALAIPMPATSRRKPTVPILFGAILVALFAAPMVLSPYHMTLLIPFLGYSVVLLGFKDRKSVV